MFDDVIALSFLLTLGRGAVALFLLWGMLRVFDYLGGINFKDWINDATTHDRALYFGLRFAGGAILLGQIFS